MATCLKRLKKAVCVFSAFVMMSAFASCDKNAEIPDLPESMTVINCISREKGSGTKEVFEKSVGTSADGTNNVAESNSDMEKQISEDLCAIGYTAFCTTELSENAKYISVDGVSVSADTIKNGKYPLTRNYYLCYNGEMSAVSKDFLKYIMGAGQKLVGEEAVSVHKTTSFLSDKSKGKIKICGSTSVAPLMKKLAEDYKKYNPNAEISVEESDSSAGLNSAIRNECDFAMSSRELESYESELLTKKTIAKDAIAITVNSKNPIDDLGIKQIKKIYDGDYKNWMDMK